MAGGGGPPGAVILVVWDIAGGDPLAGTFVIVRCVPPPPFRRLPSLRFLVPRHWQPRRPAARSFVALRDAAPRLPGCRHHQRPGRAPVECLASTPAGRRSAADGGTAMRRYGGLARAARPTRFCPGMGQRQGVPPYPLRDSRPLATPRSRCWASRPLPMSTGHLVHMARAGYILFTTYRRPCALFARRWAGESFALPLLTSTNVRTALPVVLPRLETTKSCPRPVRSTLYPALRYCRA